MNRKKALGRGLAAMIPQGAADDENKRNLSELPLDQINTNPNQPRKEFNEEAMMELVSSISEHGIIQPITVSKISDDNYELIAGERRYRACKYLNFDTIPTYVRDINSEQERMELALIENIQRADLNPIEEAQSYSTLIESFTLSQESLAKRVGKKRSTITNSLRLLKLPPELQASLISQKEHFTAGHARAVLALEDTKRMVNAWNRILDEKLSVRKTEELVNRLNLPNDGSIVKTSPSVKKAKSQWQKTLENKLQTVMGTRVQLKLKAQNEGKIEIEYYSKEDLDRLIEMFDSIDL